MRIIQNEQSAHLTFVPEGDIIFITPDNTQACPLVHRETLSLFFKAVHSINSLEKITLSSAVPSSVRCGRWESCMARLLLPGFLPGGASHIKHRKGEPNRPRVLTEPLDAAGICRQRGSYVEKERQQFAWDSLNSGQIVSCACVG